MAKEMWFSSRNSKNKLGDKRKNFKEEDRISQLPDEVIVSILSLLTIREATRTSVLSRRWEKLWTFFTGSLNFDFGETPFRRPEEKFGKHERSNYINWVNQVLASLDGSSSSNINDFILHFDSDKDSGYHIDRWVQFALKRRVRLLELDMKSMLCGFKAFVRYSFSLEFCTGIKQPRGLYSSISALTSLCLKYVDISGELIEHFLSICPLLERLCVISSEQLLNLKVTGDAKLQLKYLEISKCFNLESLEVSAPNLLSLIYFGPKIILHVENVPQLVAVSIGRDINMLSLFSSYFTQLETLKLDFEIEDHKESLQYLELPKLKHLVLRIYSPYDDSLIGWTPLIKASPFLHKFTLESVMIAHPRFRRKMPKVTKCPHQSLKVVELVGFVGCSSDVEIVMYLLASAIALEKIIINCRSPNLVGTRWQFGESLEEKAAKKRALRLKGKLPPGVHIVVV